VPDAPRGILMNYAELQFILAEAREQGWITTGDAETYYLNGIQSNFSYWQAVVPASYNLKQYLLQGYFTQPGVAYSGQRRTSLKNCLQKWISLYFVGLEAWFDWRRTECRKYTRS
jgi:hypothetical protein